ncbi:hypothetical protein BYT27DRAFT_6753821 [Phlegmacium glaucopus]|nr:hypothetical protein BYT27DRAFT_6753821 [Phlegmacium glaucopus]
MQPGVQGAEPPASPESVLEAGKAERRRAEGTGSWLVITTRLICYIVGYSKGLSNQSFKLTNNFYDSKFG